MKYDFSIRLPGWVRGYVDNADPSDTEADRMRYVVELSLRNIQEGTGGPFGAAVFDKHTCRLVSLGVNVVSSSGLSLAHAEMVAISLAQARLGSICLKECLLYTSCQPCAMCLGAIPWSGLGGIVCGAREEDARAIGFDEGDKPNDWPAALRRRGIEVRLDVLREEAKEVLLTYQRMQGTIY